MLLEYLLFVFPELTTKDCRQITEAMEMHYA